MYIWVLYACYAWKEQKRESYPVEPFIDHSVSMQVLRIEDGYYKNVTSVLNFWANSPATVLQFNSKKKI